MASIRPTNSRPVGAVLPLPHHACPRHYAHDTCARRPKVDLQYLSTSALPDLLRAIDGGGDDGGTGSYQPAEIELLRRRLAVTRVPDTASGANTAEGASKGADVIHIATFVAWWHHGTLPPPPPRPPPSPALLRLGSTQPPLEGPQRLPSLKQLPIAATAAAGITSVMEPNSPPVMTKEGSTQDAFWSTRAPASAPAPASAAIPALSLSASTNQDLVIQFNTHQRKGIVALKLELGFGDDDKRGLNESSQDQEEDEEGRSSGGGGGGSGSGSGDGGASGLATGSTKAEAEAVATWLMSAKGLSKRKVGEYLGGIDPFQQMVLDAFMRHPDNNFTGMALDEALRALLVKFRLPGEAQQISRVLESFGARLHGCNPSMFR